jgi:hypothetical protein
VEAENHLMLCWMADDSVVVIKFWPMKAGNSVEGKTGMTLYISYNEVWEKVKSTHTSEGMKFKRRLLEDLEKILIEAQSG